MVVPSPAAVAEPRGWLVRRPRCRPPKVGAYATATFSPEHNGWLVRLTDEGRAAVAAWMEKYPYPLSLLRQKFGRLYTLLVSKGIPEEDINAACVVGTARGFSRYDPARETAPSTAVGWGIRGAVSDLLRDCQRHDREHPSSLYWTGSPDDVGEGPPEPAAREEETPDPGVLGRLAELVGLAGLTHRHRLVLYCRFALGQTNPQIAEHMGVSRERVRQIEAEALGRLRAAAAGSGVDTVHTCGDEDAQAESEPKGV